MNMFNDNSLPYDRPGSPTATFPQSLLAKPAEAVVVDKALHRHRPILVTGSHYSGSTWVGKMLSQGSDVGYIHEPFHPRHSKGICAAKIEYPFAYLAPHSASCSSGIKNMLGFKYSLLDAVRSGLDFQQLKSRLQELIQFNKYRLSCRRALIKDSNALFSADWLAKTFDMDVVIVVRHPAAFAASLKVADCRTPFVAFQNQPELMREHLSPFDAQIQQFAWQQPDIIDEAILLWRMMHLVILRFAHYHPNWIFVRHEDLSRNPLSSFGRIYQALGLDYNSDIQRVVEDHSSSRHAASGRVTNDIKRNSMANLHTWSNRLTDSEILRIKDGTEDFASHFYNDDDWLHG